MKRAPSRFTSGVLALLAVSPILSSANDEGVLIRSGFVSGQQYLALAEEKQSAYAMGVVDGILLAPIFGAPKKRMLQLEDCLTGMSDTQVAAILTKYLRDHPARWHDSAHVLMYSALLDACPK